MESKNPLLVSFLNTLLKPLTQNFFDKISKNKNVEKIISLYGDQKFTKIRFWDAPFIEIERMVSKKGSIVDLGCGEGIFTNYLAICSPKRKILGIEIDKNRLSLANKGLANVTFKQGDAIKVQIPKSENIILFHLLHHLRSFTDQEKVIKNCLKSLNKKGKLIIIEVDVKLTFKYIVSLITDCFIVPWIFEKRFFTPVYYRKASDWRKLIKGLGFKCKIKLAENGKPFTHIILECSKMI